MCCWGEVDLLHSSFNCFFFFLSALSHWWWTDEYKPGVLKWNEGSRTEIRILQPKESSSYSRREAGEPCACSRRTVSPPSSSWAVTLRGKVCLLASHVSWTEASLEVMLRLPQQSTECRAGLPSTLHRCPNNSARGGWENFQTNFKKLANSKNQRPSVNAQLLFPRSFPGTCAARSADVTLVFWRLPRGRELRLSPCADWRVGLCRGPSRVTKAVGREGSRME